MRWRSSAMRSSVSRISLLHEALEATCGCSFRSFGALQALELACAVRRPARCAGASAPRIERDHVQVVGRAVAGEAGAVALPLRACRRAACGSRCGSARSSKKYVHELFAREVEDEVVLAFAAVAGLAAAGAAAATAFGALDAVAFQVLLVARMHVLAVAAAGRGRTPARTCRARACVTFSPCSSVADVAAARPRARTASRIWPL